MTRPPRPSAPPAEAEWVPLSSISPWEANPRNNSEAVQQVADSIKRFGWGNPILVRRQDGVVIAGHTRLKAAQHLGLDKVLVRWLDLDPAQAKALALADNKLGEIATWGDDGLAEVLRELEAEQVDLVGLGWSDAELDALLKGEVEPGRGLTPGETAPGYADQEIKRVPLLYSADEYREFIDLADAAIARTGVDNYSAVVLDLLRASR